MYKNVQHPYGLLALLYGTAGHGIHMLFFVKVYK